MWEKPSFLRRFPDIAWMKVHAGPLGDDAFCQADANAPPRPSHDPDPPRRAARTVPADAAAPRSMPSLTAASDFGPKLRSRIILSQSHRCQLESAPSRFGNPPMSQPAEPLVLVSSSFRGPKALCIRTESVWLPRRLVAIRSIRFWVFLGGRRFAAKAPRLRLGFAWISLDSLVRIETFQWLRGFFAEPIFTRAPLA